MQYKVLILFSCLLEFLSTNFDPAKKITRKLQSKYSEEEEKKKTIKFQGRHNSLVCMLDGLFVIFALFGVVPSQVIWRIVQKLCHPLDIECIIVPADFVLSLRVVRSVGLNKYQLDIKTKIELKNDLKQIHCIAFHHSPEASSVFSMMALTVNVKISLSKYLGLSSPSL